MKKRFALWLAILMLLSVAGCGAESPEPAAGQTAPTTQPSDSGLIQVEILTADERVALQEFLNKKENNGFVGTLYDAPEKVSLEWALYDGAGVGAWVSDWDEAEKQALLSAGGWEEFYVGVMKFPAAAVEQLVQEKLGISMDKLEIPFEFIYLEEYDAYYHMHSDTAYLEMVVVDGSRSADGLYYVQYRHAVDPHTLYKVTLRQVEGGYQFVSNTEWTPLSSSQSPLTLALEEAPEGAQLYEDTQVEMYNETLKLTANRKLLGLRFMTIHPDTSLLDETLYSLPALEKNEVLYIHTYINDVVPNRGVACTDEEGNAYYYTLVWSGVDGSISLQPMESAEASPSLLEDVQTYLNQTENNGFVGSSRLYNRPEEVSLYEVLYVCASKVDDTEKEACLKEGIGFEPAPLFKMTAAEMEALVEEKLGISPADLIKGTEGLQYRESTDAYYLYHTDSNYDAVTVLDVAKAPDGLYTVRYYTAVWGQEKTYKVTLRQVEGDYQFVSNTEI